MSKYASIRHRLHDNSVLDGNGCYVWVRQIDTDGYGQITIKVNGKVKKLKAHRVSFEECVRKLEKGEQVDHICYNTSCINPDHLQAVTPKQNCKRRRRNVAARVIRCTVRAVAEEAPF